MADQRILRGVAATLSFQNVDQDGAAVAPSGAVTVGVARADGSSVLAAGTATAGTGAAVRTVALTAAQNNLLDTLTATWTDAGDASVHTTTVEVVGGYYLSVAQLRALKNIGDASKFTDAELIAARAWFEDLAESYCGVAFVPRYTRAYVDGGGGSSLVLPSWPVRSVRAVSTVDTAGVATAFTADELTDLSTSTWGEATRRAGSTFTAGTRNLIVGWEHGWDRPPAELVEAAKVAVRDRLLGDNSGRPIIAMSDEVTRFGTAGEGRPTGNDDVDGVLNRLRSAYRVPALA